MEWLTEKMNPVMDFLFPELSRTHPARQQIAVNMIANMLGLGMAATPAGLNAMRLLQKDNRKTPETATGAMCTFLIINISSLQLIPINLIAYRSQYGAANPAQILGPALIATSCSTITAVIFCRWMNRKEVLYAGRRKL
jgi:spore maturation protein A